MATKSIIEIDILDDKFKAFQKEFEKYQKALKGMPKDWQQVNNSLNNINNAQQKFNKSVKDGAKALENVAVTTGNIARNLASSAVSISKWIALGAIGGGFGLGGIASSASDYRKRAQGIGTSTGSLRAAEVSFGRYISPEGVLTNIADIQSDLSRRQILSRLGGGQGDTAEQLPNVIRQAVNLFKQGGQTQQYAEALGLTQVFSLQELRRLSSLNAKELEDTIKEFQSARKKLEVSDADSKTVQDFYVNLRLAGQQIETTLIKAIAPFSDQLTEVSRIITEELAKGIMEFANYLNSPDGKQALSDFFEGIKMVSNFIFSVFGAVPQVKRGLTIMGQKVFGDSTDIAGRTDNLTDKSAVALKYFMGQGFSKAQASGIVGNLLQESGLNIGAVGDKGKAFGIAQWHPDRQAEFARVFGHDIRSSSFSEQLQFIMHEFQNKEQKAYQDLMRQSTVAGSTESFMKGFERPSESAGNLPKRIQFATAVNVNVKNDTGNQSVVTVNALPGATQ